MGTYPLTQLKNLFADGRLKEGSAWIVPSSMHQPIQQDALLLNSGKDNPAATSLLGYLRSEKIKTLIRSFGYDL